MNLNDGTRKPTDKNPSTPKPIETPAQPRDPSGPDVHPDTVPEQTPSRPSNPDVEP